MILQTIFGLSAYRGFAQERQNELGLQFGINKIDMYRRPAIIGCTKSTIAKNINLFYTRELNYFMSYKCVLAYHQGGAGKYKGYTYYNDKYYYMKEHKIIFDDFGTQTFIQIHNNGTLKIYGEVGIFAEYIWRIRNIVNFEELGREISVLTPQSQDLTSFNYGLGYGIGMRIPIAKKLYVHFEYNCLRGIMNIYRLDNHLIKTRSNGFRFGVSFEFSNPKGEKILKL